MLHLFRFHHGLGDTVQLTVVLRHLAEFRPGWTIDVQTRHGAHSSFGGLVRRSFTDDAQLDPRVYDSVQDLAWPEAWQCYADSPSTKAERSLREVFGLQPVERLCRYHVQPTHDAEQRAVEYLERVCGSARTAGVPCPRSRGHAAAERDNQARGGGWRQQHAHDKRGHGTQSLRTRSLRYNAALIHYQGNSARSRKNLDERIVAGLIRHLTELGVQPLLLDWERQSGLAREGVAENAAADERLWDGRAMGDGATLAALIARVRLFVGIDSGPGHIAGATDTPAIIVWRRHHPLHFFGLSPTVTHLVPDDHAQFLRGDQAMGKRYFCSRYQHRAYRDLSHTLPRLAGELLDLDVSHEGSGLLVDIDHWLRPEHRAADAAVVREVYLDDCYRCGELPCRPRTIVDVGAHIGSFARRARQQFPQAKIVCVEANPANVAALSLNVAGFATVLPAACTYEATPQRLLSSVFAGSPNTGASRLTPRDNWSWDHATYRDAGDVPTVTLEEIQAAHGWPRIDLLKLDCEGSEFSILEQCDLSRIGLIVGEYHGRERFDRLVRRRFFDWRLRLLRDGEIGLFWLSPPGVTTIAPDELPESDFLARWGNCSDCDQLHGAHCTMTGADVRRDARRPDAHCPMGRWQAKDEVERIVSRDAQAERLRELLSAKAADATLLLRFPHGLGDHVQLTSVLLHLRRYFPQVIVDVACRLGSESMFAGLCRRAVRLGTETSGEYDHAVTLRWPEPNQAFCDSPSTKAERCLREVFGIQPDRQLCRYQIAADSAANARVAEFLRRIGTAGRAVLFHYQGRCGRRLKDLDETIARSAMQAARDAGCVPIVLDWGDDNARVCAGLAVNVARDGALWEIPGTGDAVTIAALARQSRMCIGVDSGPGHIFAATETPTIIVWNLLHPVNYFAPTSNVTHWVPATHGRFIRGRRQIGEAYFKANYQHQFYHNLAIELPANIEQRLQASNPNAWGSQQE